LVAAEALFDKESLIARDQETRGYPLLMTSRSESKDRSKKHRFQMPFDRDLSHIYDSGIVTYKTWKGDYLLFRATPFGYNDCPHSHDAGLGVILYLKGVPIFVDSGVGSYTQSRITRNQFRSASGKNTVLVNGVGPSNPEDWFSWSKTTDCELVSLKRFTDGFSARGKHNGFSEGSDRHVFLQREVTMLDEGIVTIVDQWDADAEISVQAKFTLHPALELDAAQQMLRAGEQTVHFGATCLDPSEELEFVHNTEPFSSNYGQISDTNSISFQATASRRGGIVTILSRAGSIQWLPDRRVQFENDETGIQLVVTAGGVKPVQSDSRPPTFVD
jgi:hypothetical protein